MSNFWNPHTRPYATDNAVTPQRRTPAFHIGAVPIYGRTALAPMAGYSDLPMRALCAEMGSAIHYTACVLDDPVIHGNSKTAKLVARGADESPFAVQLLGNDPGRLLEACHVINAQRPPDFYDLNLGCPSRRVVRRERGSALMRQPERVAAIMSHLVQHLDMPVTAKIRLGWDDETRNAVDIARLLQDNGAAAVAVHGRTRAQGYGGDADWEAIAQVREAIDIPMLANGDVRVVADIDRLMAVTGCEGVLIGRGAIGNPWIFGRIDVADIAFAERQRVIERHLSDMVAYYGERVGMVLFRKHVIRYTRRVMEAALLRKRLWECRSADAMRQVLDDWPYRANA